MDILATPHHSPECGGQGRVALQAGRPSREVGTDAGRAHHLRTMSQCRVADAGVDQVNLDLPHPLTDVGDVPNLEVARTCPQHQTCPAGCGLGAVVGVSRIRHLLIADAGDQLL